MCLFYEDIENTKGVIRIRKDRQHNGQKEKVQKDKQRSTKQKIIHETSDLIIV